MWRILGIACTAALLIACSANNKTESKAPKKSASSADEALLRDASNRLIGDFSRNLKGALMSAMAKGGAANAISVCSSEAPQIAKAASGQYWSIKRVSDRYRNPDNEADSHQLAIMDKFRDTIPDHLSDYSEWSGTDSARIFSYYKPIYIAPLCLNCHGGTDKIAPEAIAAIDAKYPEDHATEYKVGDLRGLFVVTVKWPEGKESAEKMVTGSLNPGQKQ
ncbi:MAG TPA: DUF3365 domain-containing protein [candidate division Zixibacteria bacterium]|nr:DUF3365 domain-containing protein [candidate division Zixibacteria bacterium]